MANWWEQAMRTGHEAGRNIGPDVFNKMTLVKNVLAANKGTAGKVGEVMGLPRYPVEQAAEDPMRALSTMARITPGIAPWFLAGDVTRGLANEPTAVKGILKGISHGVAPKEVPMKSARQAMLDRGSSNLTANIVGGVEQAFYWTPLIKAGLNKLSSYRGPKGLTIEGPAAESLTVERNREALKGLQRLGHRVGWEGLTPSQQAQYNTLKKVFITGTESTSTLRSGVGLPSKQQTFDFMGGVKNTFATPTAMEQGAALGAGVSKVQPIIEQLAWKTTPTPGTTIKGAGTPDEVYKRVDEKAAAIGLDPDNLIINIVDDMSDSWGSHDLQNSFGVLKDYIEITKDHPGVKALADTYAEEMAHGIESRKGYYNDAMADLILKKIDINGYQAAVHRPEFDRLKELVKSYMFEDLTPGVKFTGEIVKEPTEGLMWQRGVKNLQGRFDAGKARVEDAIQKLTPFKEEPKIPTVSDFARFKADPLPEMVQESIDRGYTKQEMIDRFKFADGQDPGAPRTDLTRAAELYDQTKPKEMKAKEPDEVVPAETEVIVDLFGEAPAAPTGPATPDTPVQDEFDFSGFPYKRFYRPIGKAQPFSNPNLYAHHAGFGPEHDILSSAYDQYTVKKSELREQRAMMDKMFVDAVPWHQRSKVPNLKKQFELELENPRSDFSTLPPQLQELGTQMRREFDSMFMEENAARRMRGEAEYPYRQGYIRRLYEGKVMDMIQKNQDPTVDITGGFEYGLKAQLKFGPEEQRSDFESGRLFDPVEAFIRRKEEHFREMLFKPAFRKVQANVYKLKEQKHPMPPDAVQNINDFIKYTMKGVELPSNEQWNNSFNALNKHIGGILGDRPFTNVTNALLKVQYLGTLWGNLRQYTRNPLQSVHHISMYGVPNAVKAGVRMLGGARADGSMEKAIRNPFLLDPTKGVMGKIQDFGFAPLRQTDMFNIMHASETARAWGESLEVNEGWKGKMKALAEKHGLPEDAYEWTARDTVRESEFAIQVAQYKYAVSGRPEIYRRQEMKAIGGLFSWPMNYWGTFGRELLYRFFTGRTGWADGNGIHKPIPTAARLAAGQYLLLMGTITALLGKAGLDYGSQFLLGTVPSGANPVTQSVLGLAQLSLGAYRVGVNPNDKRAKKLVSEAKYRLETGMKSLMPGAASVKKVTKVTSGEKPWWTLFAYPKYEPKPAMPSRQNVKYGIFKGVEKPPTGKSFLDS